MKKLFFILSVLIAFGANAQRISTFAGKGTVGGYSGDGGPATAATLALVQALAIDALGNMYISAQGIYPNLRKVDTAGIITSIAGTPFNGAGFSGDGGMATAAKLDDPGGIILDKKGNVYFFDRNNKRIRRIDTFGIITTFAGNGAATPSGDGGPATAAGIGAGTGLCIDNAGYIYI